MFLCLGYGNDNDLKRSTSVSHKTLATNLDFKLSILYISILAI